MTYDFIHYQTGSHISLSYEDMKKVYDILNIYPEDLAEVLTGMTIDCYSDTAVEAEDGDSDYDLCRAFHRILNVQQPDNDHIEKAWLESLTLTEA